MGVIVLEPVAMSGRGRRVEVQRTKQLLDALYTIKVNTGAYMQHIINLRAHRRWAKSSFGHHRSRRRTGAAGRPGQRAQRRLHQRWAPGRRTNNEGPNGGLRVRRHQS